MTTPGDGLPAALKANGCHAHRPRIGRWRAVTRREPCPACEKTDWCAWSPDRKLLRCMRGGNTPPGMTPAGRDKDGGTLFRPIDPLGVPAPKKRRLSRGARGGAARSKQPEGPVAERQLGLKALDDRFQAALTDQQAAALADMLGVTVAALRALGLGWASGDDLRVLGASGAGWREDYPDGAYAFVERDGRGRLAGFSFRAADGRKGAPASRSGCRRGLVIPARLHQLGEPVLVVEGSSDVAACLVLGLAAVGRLSNSGGADDLAVLLDGRDLLVVGENDGKDSGAWPGRDGAKRVAERLAAAEGEPVAWTLPPPDSKDVREWLRARVAAGLDLADSAACRTAGGELLAALKAEARPVKPQKMSAADRMVRLALDQYRLGVSEDREPFAVRLDGPNVALPIGKGSELRSKLAAEYQRQFGKAPAAAALADALAVLEGQAREGEPEPVAIRLAPHDGGIVLDLGSLDGAAVVIRSGSWEVVERSPVIFRRTALTSPLPVPERGGFLDDLRGLLNVTDESWPLIRGWLVAAVVPDVPHPVLMLGGEQGTGKSSAARLLVGLFDPSPAPLRSQPKDPEAWAMAAAGCWGVVIDNVSGITEWFSDALCKAVTGDGWIRRTLYTDRGLSVLSFRRVVVLTSIDAGALRGDLAERLLVADLERIDPSQRLTEAELHARYEAARPRLLGSLLDLVAAVLDALPRVTTRELPRMADFARVLAALDLVDGTDGVALDLFSQQAGRLAHDVIESDPVAVAIVSLAEGSQDGWRGTAGELLGRITPERAPHGWPKSPRGLAARLKRLRPALARIGVEVRLGQRGTDKLRERLVTVENLGDTTVRTVRSPDHAVDRNRKPSQTLAIREQADDSDGSDGSTQQKLGGNIRTAAGQPEDTNTLAVATVAGSESEVFEL